MIVLILLIIEFGWFFYCRMVVPSAAFDAARTAARGGTPQEAHAAYRELIDLLGPSYAAEYGDSLELRLPPEDWGDQAFTDPELEGMRSVEAHVNVEWTSLTGVWGLVGIPNKMTISSDAFFRLEQFYGGPGDEFE
jgi:hypothetical protein